MASKAPCQPPESKSKVKPSQIFIKSLGDGVLVVPADARSTVAEIMSYIKSRKNIPVDLQRLTFAGKQLDPKFSLSDYDIQIESTLHLSSRLLGGQLQQWQQIILYISIVIFGIPIFAKLKQLINQQIAMLTASEEWDEEGGEEQ
jgi:large subunit ribosomal protein L40e